MIALLAVYDSDSCTGICDVRCYDATTSACACACICGGHNHGIGLRQAVINTGEHALEWLDRAVTADPSITAADIMPAVLLSPERPGSTCMHVSRPGAGGRTITAAGRPGLLDVIAAFFVAGREPRPGQVYRGPCDRTEPGARAGRQSPA